MPYLPSEVPFHKQTLALIKCILSWGYCRKGRGKPTSLFSPLNSTQAAISMKHRRAGWDVWLPVSKAGGIICKERLRFAVVVVVAAADRKHFLFISSTTAPRPARGAQAGAGPAPPSSPSAFPLTSALAIFPQRPPRLLLNRRPSPAPRPHSTLAEERGASRTLKGC